MSDRHRRNLTSDEEALDWIEALRTADVEQRRAFALWVRRSPEHLEAFLRQQALSTELQGMPARSASDREALMARVRTANKIVWFPRRARPTPLLKSVGASRSRNLRTCWPRWAAAALMVIAVLAGLWNSGHIWTSRSSVYSTATGEQRNVQLADGSIMELNTQSSVRVDVTSATYEVYLLRGEALFDVRHNPARPFRVHAGRTLVEDVGTQFTVRRTEDLTMVAVSVVAGSVRVSPDKSTDSIGKSSVRSPVVVTGTEYQPLHEPVRIVAGEQARVVDDGLLIERNTISIAQAVAWRQGRLSFSGATLAEIIAEFNRYNTRKIILYGDSLGKHRYSGVFSARDPESFVAYLREDNGIEVEDSKDDLVVRRR
jgi:transmembrane sensor